MTVNFLQNGILHFVFTSSKVKSQKSRCGTYNLLSARWVDINSWKHVPVLCLKAKPQVRWNWKVIKEGEVRAGI